MLLATLIAAWWGINFSLAFEGPGAIADAARGPSPAGLASLAFIAYVSTLLCFGAWGWLMRRYEASSVATYSLLVPPFGLLAAGLLLGEHVTATHLAGAVRRHHPARRHPARRNEMRHLRGIHASLVTPFTRSGNVDAKMANAARDGDTSRGWRSTTRCSRSPRRCSANRRPPSSRLRCTPRPESVAAAPRRTLPA